MGGRGLALRQALSNRGGVDAPSRFFVRMPRDRCDGGAHSPREAVRQKAEVCTFTRLVARYSKVVTDQERVDEIPAMRSTKMDLLILLGLIVLLAIGALGSFASQPPSQPVTVTISPPVDSGGGCGAMVLGILAIVAVLVLLIALSG
jgi:hypothetical protein